MTMNKKMEVVLFLTWVQAFIATLGSLYFSEVKEFIPCNMCWYSRILMYPLIIIYGISLAKKDLRYAEAGLYLSGIGILMSGYHYVLQKLPAVESGFGSCSLVPCDGQYINWFGFITIPLLAFVAFVVIFSCHVWLKRLNKEQ